MLPSVVSDKRKPRLYQNQNTSLALRYQSRLLITGSWYKVQMLVLVTSWSKWLTFAIFWTSINKRDSSSNFLSYSFRIFLSRQIKGLFSRHGNNIKKLYPSPLHITFDKLFLNTSIFPHRLLRLANAVCLSLDGYHGNFGCCWYSQGTN